MTAQDHDRIWLEPKCAENSYEGRQWCQDDVWEHCEECDLPSVEYIRADLLDAAEARVKELEAVLREIEADCDAEYPPSHGAIKYAIRAALEGEK